MNNPGGASVHVNETDLHFGDVCTATVEPPNHVQGVLALSLQIFQDGKIVSSQGGYPILDQFTLYATQSWTGGAAHAVFTLYDFNPKTANTKVLATDEFEIGA